jgi:ubiquitin C-terminal hydrolase
MFATPSRQSIINRRITFKKVSNDSIDPQYVRLRKIYKPINVSAATSIHSYHSSAQHDDYNDNEGREQPDSNITTVDLSWRSNIYPSPVGLINAGNSCFLNSVMQCLMYLQPLFNYIITRDHQSKCHATGFCALCNIYQHAQRCIKSQNHGGLLRKPFMPVPFIKGLRSTRVLFNFLYI